MVCYCKYITWTIKYSNYFQVHVVKRLEEGDSRGGGSVLSYCYTPRNCLATSLFRILGQVDKMLGSSGCMIDELSVRNLGTPMTYNT